MTMRSWFGDKLSFVSMLGLALASCHPQTKSGVPSSCVASEDVLGPDQIESVLQPNIVQVVSDAGAGSGFILQSDSTDDVLIVTNYHVIAEGSGFEVVFAKADGSHVRVSNVEVVKTNPHDDLALLRAPRLVVFGNGLMLESSARRGQSVVTLGYPRLLENEVTEPTLSSGLVTSKNQRVREQTFLQSNLKLVPGNSGGPAVDSCGRVIGVTTAFLAQADHVGLLVPADRVEALVKEHSRQRAPIPDEVRERLSAFMGHLQQDDGESASSFFSRGFLATTVLPLLQKQAQQILFKQQMIAGVRQQLENNNIDTSDATDADIVALATEAGYNLDMSNDERIAYVVFLRGKQEGWDNYRMLQAFFAPYLDAYFGEIQSFHVNDVREKGDTGLAHLIIDSPHSRADYRIELVREWGDWQISNLEVINAPTGGHAISRDTGGDDDQLETVTSPGR